MTKTLTLAVGIFIVGISGAAGQEYRWDYLGSDIDCPESDIGQPFEVKLTSKGTVDYPIGNCSQEFVNKIAVCWDQVTRLNKFSPDRPFCIMKNKTAGTCHGGQNPGYAFACRPAG